jgi:hypothetical protein
MNTHKLKILPEYFIAVQKGIKTFEIRKNDRNYQVGDRLILQEYYNYAPNEFKLKGCYTGNEITKKITYILEGGQYGLEEGYVILSIEEVK